MAIRMRSLTHGRRAPPPLITKAGVGKGVASMVEMVRSSGCHFITKAGVGEGSSLHG